MSIKAEYYSWLCALIDTYKYRGHGRLLLQLHNRMFKSYIPNDHNRIFDGKNLREMFCMENGIFLRADLDTEDISMLELVVSLAMRCESMMADFPKAPTVSEWFWMLLGHTDLLVFTNSEYDDHGGESKVDQILTIIIERQYSRFGKGGLFPLKKPKKDQRKVELWYQMCYFLVEKYNIDGMDF